MSVRAVHRSNRPCHKLPRHSNRTATATGAIEQEHFAADFAADISPAVSHFMAVSQVPISTDSFTHEVANPAWKSKPSWFMVATIDRSINPHQERMMAKRARAKTVEVTASHVAYMSDPKETAQRIEEAATSAHLNW
jgi:pimeloyl-ACP methyl ester carboxylesterase